MSEPERHPAQPNDTAVPAPLAERLCLLVLLALIPLRAVISETHTFEVPRMFRHVDVPDGAQPATTFGIFIVILAVAAMLSLARWRRSANRAHTPENAPSPWTGLETGAALLVVAMLVSTIRAGQKHLAIIGSLDFLGLLIYVAVLRRLLTRPWHLRLTLCVILATGAMVVAKCAYQHWIETPETIRYFEAHRDELLSTSKQEDASNQAGFLHDYEQRLRSGAVTGYFAHPNVLGSYLILIVMCGLAVLAMRWSRAPRWSLAAPGIVTTAALIALAASQSKGAMTGCGVAIVVFAGGMLWRRRWSKRPVLAAILIWLLCAAAALVVTTTLNARQEALGKSMLFRHFYWRGAAAMIGELGWLGIGADNFGRHFSRYKDAACPEDVDDPHSWPVKAAAEWGILGLTGMLLVFAGLTRRLTSAGGLQTTRDAAARRAQHTDFRSSDAPSHAAGSIVLWTGGIGAMFFAWWALLISGTTSGYAVLTLHLPAFVWVIFFPALAMEDAGKHFTNQEPSRVLPALIGAIVGFVLHSGVDLAMFNGGAATTFFAVIAIALAAREGFAREDWRATDRPQASNHAEPATGVTAICSVAFIAAAVVSGWLLVLPAARLGEQLQIARVSEAPERWEQYVASTSYHAYLDGAQAYRLDATAFGELLEQLTARVASPRHVDEGLRLTDELHARDRDNSAVWQHRATLYFQRYVLVGDLTDLREAIAAMETFVAAYPTSPNRRMILADLYERLAAATDAPEARRAAAAEQLSLALRLDDQRIHISKPHRLTPAQRAQLEERIARLTASP